MRSGRRATSGPRKGAGGVSDAQQHLPSLHLRPVGRPVATPPCPPRCRARALRRGTVTRFYRGEYETDAKRFLADLRERLEKFALSPIRIRRLIELGRFAAEASSPTGVLANRRRSTF